MLKKVKLVFLVLFSFIFFLGFTNNVKASNFVIDQYNVNIEVTKENNYLVIEDINADFLYESHGIYRYIPFRFPNRPDLYSKIENVIIPNYNYEKSTTEQYGYKFLNLKIGDADKTLIGKQQYVIQYDYLVGKFAGDQYIAYNLMGNMSTQILKGTFKIKLPYKVNADDIKFFQGEMGSNYEPKVEYQYIEDSTGYYIEGKTTEAIGDSEYLTVFIPVDDSYFVGAPVLKSWYQQTYIGMLALAILVLSLSIYLWYRFGRDKKIVEVIEFYPPENLTPLEVSQIYKEVNPQLVTVSQIKECTSLFYYLANKGYIIINFTEKKDFNFEKTDKVLENEENHVKVFYDQIFKDKNIVTKADLEETLYSAASTAIVAVKDRKLVDSKSLVMRVLIFGVSLLPIIFSIVTFFDHFNTLLVFAIGFLVIIGSILNIILSYNLEKSVSGIKEGKGIFAVALFLIITITTFIIFIVANLYSFVLIYMIVQLSLVVAMFIKKRNDSAIILLGRIKGFRQFIEVARKNELEKLIEENPYYFFDVLPYAHVLGVSKIFANKFDGIDMVTPQYYQSNNTLLSYGLLYNNLYIMNNMAQASYLHNQQVNSKNFGGGGSFSGGGGFSGGGFGGGGGGSW